MQSPLFRQQALDELSSPDQLDQLMRVAPPRRWIALGAIGVLLVGALLWGFLGRIDASAAASCVISPRGGSYKVVTTPAGTVHDVLVDRGDHLDAGQAVAVVESADGTRHNVVAPFSGEVIELLATFGDYVDVGADILTFQSDQEPLGVLLYVPPGLSGQLRTGMEVRISPTTAGRQTYGFLDGTVDEVAPYPSTEDGMLALLNNPTLVAQLFHGSSGAPVEVWVRPTPAPTPTGFAWSSSDGPASLRAGTLCSADIVLDHGRPLDLVLP